jgi:hypothetical protein
MFKVRARRLEDVNNLASDGVLWACSSIFFLAFP